MLGPYDNFSRSAEIADKLAAIVPGGSHTYSKGVDQFPSTGRKSSVTRTAPIAGMSTGIVSSTGPWATA